ncbi:unnamed protein product [Prunus armeniaca]|uniref:Uncharacterized protein n=1 Tax=Prunus armeniaca TaxID=36596 RepID=A0A6J5XTR4_PRUAR|nr:unnamed protein product [Prunus armeniaca]
MLYQPSMGAGADTSEASTHKYAGSSFFRGDVCRPIAAPMNESMFQLVISEWAFPLVDALSKITSTGAMTYAFIQAIERGHGNTYGNMLNAMQSTIRNTHKDHGGGIVTSLISMLLTGGSLGGLRQI